MPNYTFIRETDGAEFTIAGDKPPSQEVVDHFAKTIPLKKSNSQVKQPEEKESLPRLQSIARTLIENLAPQLRMNRDVSIKEEGRNLLDIASFAPTPTGVLRQTPKGLKWLAANAPQAVLGGVSTYIGEREKGQLDSGETAFKQAGIELAGGAALTGAGKGLGKIGEVISAKIPNDVYENALKWAKEKSMPLATRIEKIVNEGKKAIKRNDEVLQTLENKAENAAKQNKAAGNVLSDKMKKLSKKFFDKHKMKNKVKTIENISDAELSQAISREHARLIDEAKPLIENGMILTRDLEQKALKEFEKLFIANPLISSIPFVDQYGRAIKSTKKKAPLINKKIFLQQLDQLQDKTAFGAGEDELKKFYTKTYSNLNDFLKKKSKSYKELKQLGSDIVRFAKYEADPTEYNAEKLRGVFETALETFKKNPDPNSVKVIERVVKQSNKYLKTNFSIEKALSTFNQNLEDMKFKGAKKGLTPDQQQLLSEKQRKLYNDNKELSKVTEQGFFVPKKQVKEFAENPQGDTGIRALLPPDLLEQIEIDAAKDVANQWFGKGTTGGIPLFGSAGYKALQAGKKAYQSPKLGFMGRKFAEGEYPINPQMIEGATKALNRAGVRDFFRSDKQATDTFRDPLTNRFLTEKRKPWATQRTNAGNISPESLVRLRRERGIGGNN